MLNGRMAGIAALFLTALSACSSPSSAVSSAESSDSISDAGTPPAPPPAPHYLGRTGMIYWYRADGENVGFVFQGKNRRGLNVILLADQFGRSRVFAGCADPCTTIYTDDGRKISYEPNSLLGKVYSDIENGFLKPVMHRKAPLHHDAKPE